MHGSSSQPVRRHIEVVVGSRIKARSTTELLAAEPHYAPPGAGRGKERSRRSRRRTGQSGRGGIEEQGRRGTSSREEEAEEGHGEKM